MSEAPREPRRKRRKTKKSSRQTPSRKKAIPSLDQLDPVETAKKTPAVSGQPRTPFIPIAAAVCGLVVLAAVGTWMMGDGESPEVETVADDTIAEPPAPAAETPTKTSGSEVTDAGTSTPRIEYDASTKSSDDEEAVVAEAKKPVVPEASVDSKPSTALDGIDLDGLDDTLFASLEPEELAETSRLPGDWSQLRALALASDGDRLYLGLAGGTVVCRDLVANREVWRSPVDQEADAPTDAPTEQLHAILVDADGSRVIVAGREAISMLSATDGSRRQTLPMETAVTVLAPATDDTFLSGHVDGTLVRRRISTGEELGRTTIGTAVTAVRVLAETLTVGDWDGRVHLLDAETFKPTMDAQAIHESPIHSLVGDEYAVLAASNDGSIAELQLPECEVRERLEFRSPRPLLRIGDRVLSGRQDGILELWGTDDKTITHRFVGHEAPVHGLARSATEGTVVSAGWDGTVRLWKVPK